MASSDWRHSRSIQTSLAINEDVPSIEYLAGFFDGEGCFSCTIPEREDPVRFFIQVTTTVEDEVRSFEDVFGGHVSSHHPEDSNHSTSWTWRCTGRGAKRTAERMYPHLRGKKKQCEVFIEALQHKYSNRIEGRGYTSEVLETMHDYGERVRSYSSAQRHFKEEE